MEKRNLLQQQLERKLAFIKAGRPEGLEIPAANADSHELVHEVNEYSASGLGFAFYRIEVPDVQTLKSLVGTPDELIEKGLIDDITSAPEPMNSDREKELLRSNRDIFLKETCQAFRTYIYGHSNKAKSYEKIINMLRFPTSVDVYEIKDLYIKKGEVYVFGKDDSEQHTAVLIDKLTMEEDASIQNYCCADFTVKEGNLQNNAKIDNCGTHGPDGRTPESGGAAGTTGAKGENSKSGNKSCDRNAGKGDTGGSGDPGRNGGNGGNGGSGSTLTWTFSNVEGEFPQLCCYGGNGGNGGNGTAGGKGGSGGPGGDSSSHCGAGAQGDGGTGGAGGDGGNGGNGGDGGDILLTIFLNEGQKAFTVDTKCAGGKGGSGGKGGNGGDGGDGSNRGATGKPGNSGNSGNSGQAGKINITQL
ncbi:MAG: hypothetical protein HDQ96_07990 [Lachnospiraceae bacterium]|nr:hypothetical protein [Lachnospiraceae bacterium]